jgi:hypothetical protein
MNPLECKYTKWYYNIINNCKVNPPIDCYTEIHHIKPKSIGGCNTKENLVKLTAKQHFICHLLLTKMFKPNTREYFKMIHAFCMMLWNAGNIKMYRYTSRVHEKQRQQFSEYLRLKQLGADNNQYGTIWIYNEELKECKKINKNDSIPTGWKKGRILNWEKHFEQLTKHVTIITNCVECGTELKKHSTKKTFCNSICGNAYRFKNAKIITMHKNGETKEIKAQNVPAYKKLGWYC